MSTRPARERLAAVFGRLPAKERLVLSLLLYEGLTPTESARALGCTVREIHHLVETRLPRLRAWLQAQARTRSRSNARSRRREPLRRAA